MTTVREICDYIETLAPAYMKMEWDNVGLLCGDGARPVHKILVALDPFLHVCEEAYEVGADLLVTHHPLIFRAPRAVTADDPVGRSILFLAAHGISAVNAHTNLDQAPGGVNDCLAAALELQNVRVLDAQGTDAQGRAWGLLRAGETAPSDIASFAAFVKERLRCPGLRFVGGGRLVHTVAVGGGSCGDELCTAMRAGCDTLVTADVRYNEFQNACDYGMNLIDAGHFETENPVTAYLAAALAQRFPQIPVQLAQKHRDPVQFL